MGVDIPIEIWLQIMQHSLAKHDSDVLASLVRCCRALYISGLPVLYRHCTLNSLAKAASCLETLQDNDLCQAAVRHLKLDIEVDTSFDDSEVQGTQLLKGRVKRCLTTLLPPVLRNLPNLTSLHLHIHTPGHAYLSPIDYRGHISQEWLSLIFPPLPLPFRLVHFSTSFALVPSLARFLSSQPSLRSLHWIGFRLITQGNLACTSWPCPSVSSIAITHTNPFVFWDIYWKIVHRHLSTTPSVRYLTLDTMYLFRDITNWGSLSESSSEVLQKVKGLTLLRVKDPSDIDELLHALSESFRSLEYLALFFTQPLEFDKAFRALLDIKEEIPSLHKIVFSPVPSRDLDQLIGSYTHSGIPFSWHDDAGQSPSEHVHVEFEDTPELTEGGKRVWTCWARPTTEGDDGWVHGVPGDSEMCYDEHQPRNPERLLNVASTPWAVDSEPL